jgi:NADPH2:quinone reductase
MGLYWGGYLKFAPHVVTQSLQEVLGWIASGEVTPHIGARVPFDQTPQALDLLRSREVTGKVVVLLP